MLRRCRLVMLLAALLCGVISFVACRVLLCFVASGGQHRPLTSEERTAISVLESRGGSVFAQRRRHGSLRPYAGG